MLVKELIVKLGGYDMDTRVVVDTLDGFVDLYQHVAEGSTDKFTVGEKVVVLSIENENEDDLFAERFLKAFGIELPKSDTVKEAPDIEGFRKYDISTEEFRSYAYSTVDGGKHFIIENPVTLYIKTDENGDTHRVVSADGVTHYPQRGWIGISWYAPEQEVSF